MTTNTFTHDEMQQVLDELTEKVNAAGREGFITWLQRKDPDQKVGYSTSTRSCPIKNYVNEVFEPSFEVYAYVYLYAMTPKGEEVHASYNHILSVDLLEIDTAAFHKDLHRALTAQEVLDILEVGA